MAQARHWTTGPAVTCPASPWSATASRRNVTACHREQASMIRRCTIWRNRSAHDRGLRELVKRANVA